MKTFIWNTEYEVLLANGKNVEDARSNLFQHFVEKTRKELIDEKDLDKIKENCLPSYVYHRACTILNSDVWVLIECFKKEPDYIIEENKALIYNHANE